MDPIHAQIGNLSQSRALNKNQMDKPRTKNVISEVKNSLNMLNDRLETTKENFTEVNHREKEEKRNEQASVTHGPIYV